MSDSNGLHIAILTLLIFIALNLLILDIKVFSPPVPAVRLSDIAVTASPNLPNPPYSPNPSYPFSQEAIERIVEEKLAQLTNNPNNPNNPTNSPPQGSSQGDPLQTSSQSPVREYIIPLGNGTTSKSDWEDLLGTDTMINPANYGTVQEAQLSVAIKNPTKNGVVEVRLYNVTDKYVVYGSALSSSEADSTVTSGTFAFPTGTKLYRLQAKSGLSYTATIENAKLKILAR